MGRIESVLITRLGSENWNLTGRVAKLEMDIEIANRWITQLREGRDRGLTAIQFLQNAYSEESRLLMSLEEEFAQLKTENAKLKAKVKELEEVS